jgi:hypothetical protein
MKTTISDENGVVHASILNHLPEYDALSADETRHYCIVMRCGISLRLHGMLQTFVTCMECLAYEETLADACGALGCTRGVPCGDGKFRCFRCRRVRTG